MSYDKPVIYSDAQNELEPLVGTNINALVNVNAGININAGVNVLLLLNVAPAVEVK